MAGTELTPIDPIDLRTFPPVAPLTSIPEAFRQTFLSKYTECPRAAYLYLKYNGGALSHPLAGGTLAHRAIERFMRHLLENDESMGDPETAKDILNEVAVESTDLTVSPGRFDSIRAMMFHIAEGTRINPEKVIGIETPVTLEVAGRKVTGTVDFAEADFTTSRGLVLDWKSAFLNPPRPIDDEEPDELALPTQEEWVASFQAVLYALACATGEVNGTPSPYREIDEWVLRQVHPRQFWKGEGVPAYREATITKDALLDWQFYLDSVVAQVEQSLQDWKWPAIQGSHCDFCPASAECPIPAALREWRGEIRTPDDARRAAEMWEAHSRRRGELWGAIKGYAKATGKPVRYGKDLELRWRTIETEKIKDKVEVAGSKKKIKGRVALRDAIQKAVEWGVNFEWGHFWTPSISTRLMRRKLTDEELLAEEEAAAEREQDA